MLSRAIGTSEGGGAARLEVHSTGASIYAGFKQDRLLIQVKKGPLAETSPMLNDISGIATWSKVRMVPWGTPAIPLSIPMFHISIWPVHSLRLAVKLMGYTCIEVLRGVCQLGHFLLAGQASFAAQVQPICSLSC